MLCVYVCVCVYVCMYLGSAFLHCVGINHGIPASRADLLLYTYVCVCYVCMYVSYLCVYVCMLCVYACMCVYVCMYLGSTFPHCVGINHGIPASRVDLLLYTYVCVCYVCMYPSHL